MLGESSAARAKHLHTMKFHQLIIPIAVAMVMIGLALIAQPRSLEVLRTLGSDLVLAIGSALIVFGVFCIACGGEGSGMGRSTCQPRSPRRKEASLAKGRLSIEAPYSPTFVPHTLASRCQ